MPIVIHVEFGWTNSGRRGGHDFGLRPRGGLTLICSLDDCRDLREDWRFGEDVMISNAVR